MKKRLLVIGLDSMTPELAFDSWVQEMPNLTKLRNSGIWGKLESTIPPITVPAWATMVTSKDPGMLGFYGFRNRKDFSYDKLSFVTSRWVKEKTVWDYLTAAGKRSIVVGIPPSYPPKPLNGYMISCFLTPGPESEYAYPKYLKRELEEKFGEYRLDVRNFRTDNKDWLLNEIFKLGEQRFEVIKYLAQTKDWDFLMFVEMGVDRIHHGFWQFMDAQHHRYVPGNPYENAIKDYYKFIDQKVGELLEVVESLGDEVDVMVVSDHGAKRMDGGIAIHEWLIKEGYLKLKVEPNGITRLTPDMIDWEKTMVWSEGGYYARIFLNVKGREPYGVIPKEDYEKIRDEIIEKLEELGDESGKPIGTRVYRPEEIYKKVNNIPPDLIVLFGNLYWRSVGSIGYGKVWVYENDTGPDDANHSQHGIFIMAGPSIKRTETPLKGIKIYDIGATVLEYFGIQPENEIVGKPIPFQGG